MFNPRRMWKLYIILTFSVTAIDELVWVKLNFFSLSKAVQDTHLALKTLLWRFNDAYDRCVNVTEFYLNIRAFIETTLIINILGKYTEFYTRWRILATSRTGIKCKQCILFYDTIDRDATIATAQPPVMCFLCFYLQFFVIGGSTSL